MKVLIVNDYGTPTGGAEFMSLSLRQGLRDRGHDARLFASTALPLPVENAADDTCFGTTTRLRTYLQVANPSARRNLRKILNAFNPDVVHVRMFLTQLSPFILPLLRDVPALLHVVNYRTICPTNLKLLPDGSTCHYEYGAVCCQQGCLLRRHWVSLMLQMKLWERWRGVFNRIVANSRWVQRRLIAEGVHVHEAVWNGVPVTSARPPLGEVPTVAFAGRFVAKKGVDVLVRAMAQVVTQIPRAQLLLAGDGPERQNIEDLIKQLNLSEHVVLLGHLSRPTMEQKFEKAWVQAVPSLWEEPFGLAAAEAMMRGTAVVVSDSGGLSELVEEGSTGFKAPPGDVEAWAGAMVKLLANQQLSEEIGQTARAFALDHFSEDRVVEHFVEMYEQLCHERTLGQQ